MDLQHLLGATKALPVDFDGETLNVVYTPSKISTDDLVDVRSRAAELAGMAQFAEVTGAETLCDMLAAVLVSWDLTADGEPVGTDAPTLRGLPLGIVAVVWAAIQEDMSQPGEGKRGTSAGGSPRKASGSRTKAGSPRKPGR